jgi:quercetin dioxygenase-like cupin family protein
VIDETIRGFEPVDNKSVESRSSINMSADRIFKSAEFFQPTEGEPYRSIVSESPDATIVAWYLQPGQEISPHIHPHGQDTWTILSGRGEYNLDAIGTKRSITAGDVVVAPCGCVHGVFNHGDEPLVFISVVSPLEAGYQLVASETAMAIDLSSG